MKKAIWFLLITLSPIAQAQILKRSGSTLLVQIASLLKHKSDNAQLLCDAFVRANNTHRNLNRLSLEQAAQIYEQFIKHEPQATIYQSPIEKASRYATVPLAAFGMMKGVSSIAVGLLSAGLDIYYLGGSQISDSLELAATGFAIATASYAPEYFRMRLCSYLAIKRYHVRQKMKKELVEYLEQELD